MLALIEAVAIHAVPCDVNISIYTRVSLAGEREIRSEAKPAAKLAGGPAVHALEIQF